MTVPTGSNQANAARIRSLYEALKRHDARSAAACYAEDSFFQDIGFRLKGRQRIGEMWSLVCGEPLLEVAYSDADIEADDERGRGFWTASYPPIAALPGAKANKRNFVINPSRSSFVFSPDNLILEHCDDADPKAWAAKAFQVPFLGSLMGNVEWARRLGSRFILARHTRAHPFRFD